MGANIDAYLAGGRKSVDAFMTGQTELRAEIYRLNEELKKIQNDD